MQFSKEEKAMWVEDWRRSGKKAWTYARENGLAPQTFLKWTHGKPETMSFVEVHKEVLPYPKYVQEILIEKGGMKIHIPLTIGTGELRTIISVLGGAA